MKLYFKNSKGREKLIAEPITHNELLTSINQYLDKIGVETSCYRMISRNDSTEFTIDYGSHTEFFVIKEVSNIEDVAGYMTSRKIQSYRNRKQAQKGED